MAASIRLGRGIEERGQTERHGATRVACPVLYGSRGEGVVSVAVSVERRWQRARRREKERERRNVRLRRRSSTHVNARTGPAFRDELSRAKSNNAKLTVFDDTAPPKQHRGQRATTRLGLRRNLCSDEGGILISSQLGRRGQRDRPHQEQGIRQDLEYGEGFA